MFSWCWRLIFSKLSCWSFFFNMFVSRFTLFISIFDKTWSLIFSVYFLCFFMISLTYFLSSFFLVSLTDLAYCILSLFLFRLFFYFHFASSSALAIDVCILFKVTYSLRFLPYFSNSSASSSRCYGKIYFPHILTSFKLLSITDFYFMITFSPYSRLDCVIWSSFS